MQRASEPSEIFVPDLLSGHVAIVTGGGTNIGRAAAQELARCGADVVIAGRRPDVLEDAAQIGPRCSWVSGDIREAADCERIVDTALERHGRVDTLLNDAGRQYFAAAEAITLTGLGGGDAAERRRDPADDAGLRRAGDAAARWRDDRERHGVAAPRLPGDGAQRGSARRRQGDDARTAGRSTASAPSRSRSGASTRSRCASTRGADRRRRALRPARPPRSAARVRLAGGARRLPARPLAERQHDHARRRRRRLVGPMGPPALVDASGTVPTEERRGA